MNATSILKSSNGIQCHRYGPVPVPSSKSRVRIPSLSLGHAEIPKRRSGCFASHDFARNNSLQSSSEIEYPVGRHRKLHKNFAFDVKKDILGNTLKGEDEIEIEGEVILQKASLLELTDYSATFKDEASDIVGKKVSLQLVSSNQTDPGITGEVPECKRREGPNHEKWFSGSFEISLPIS